MNSFPLKHLPMSSSRWQWRRRRWERNWQQFVQGVRHPSQSDISISKTLIYVNLIFFTLMVLQGAAAGLGTRPIFNPNTGLLLHAGGQYWPLVLNEGQWWRILTYAFTHGGIIHLAFNMIVLYQVGPLVELEIGKSRLLFLYTFTAVTGTIAGYLWHPGVPVVGASGALFGLIGFAAAYNHRLGDPVSIQRRNFMLQWAVFAFIFGLLVGADNAGHLGGALGGLLLGLIIPIRGRLLKRTDPLFNFLGTASAGLIVISLGFLVVSWI